jgi:hypothetical protein
VFLAQVSFVSTTGHTAGAFWDVILLMDGTTGVTPPGTTEFIPCGGQGLCNLGTGLCTCTGIGMYVKVVGLDAGFQRPRIA